MDASRPSDARAGNRATIRHCGWTRSMRSAQGFQRAAEHPARMRIELRADRAAQQPDGSHVLGLDAQRRAGDQVGMAADIFGQRIDRDVGAVLERLLKHRPEQRVVADDDRPLALPRRRSRRRLPADERMSTSVLSGLEGVSMKMTETRPFAAAFIGRRAHRRPRRLRPRSRPRCMPKLASVLATSVSVPP